MKRVFLISVMSLSCLMSASLKKCVEYNPADFTLKQYIYAKKIKKSVAKLESLRIYYYYEKGKLSTATVEYKANGHKFLNPYLYCDKYSGDKNYQCGIECDGGSFELNKKFAIKTDRLSLYRDDADAVNGGEKVLSQKSLKKFANGKSIACPKNLPIPDSLDESYYKDHPKGLYVCYDWKYKGAYDGCFRSLKSCKYIHRQHFGKYLTQRESKLALQRCKSSKPNKKFVDNKNGRHVCYDYKDKYGEYSGCFRTTQSCKSLGKKHFGKYPTKSATYKAFLRCTSSAPSK